MKSLWITWESQRRNPGMAIKFEAELIKYDYIGYPSPLRYTICVVLTLVSLLSRRPDYVFAPYPSAVLSLILAAAKTGLRYTFIIDAHNYSIEAYQSAGFVGSITRWIFSRADHILVTNAKAAGKLIGLPVLILPDALPNINRLSADDDRDVLRRLGLGEQGYLTLLVSFSRDEPILEVIQAVMSIPAPSRPLLCITGKKSKANANLLSFESEYIRFLDYQPQSNFDSILAHSTLLIDLTTREDCLVCGGYEALALGVPILLSDTEVARQTFGAGAIYAKNDSSSLRDAILDFLHETGRENGAWSESSFDKLRKEFLISWSLFCQRAFESIFDGRSSV